MWGYAGLQWLNWVYNRCVSGSAGMAMPGVLLAQKDKGIMCFVCALHMKGVIAVLAEKGLFFWLAF